MRKSVSNQWVTSRIAFLLTFAHFTDASAMTCIEILDAPKRIGKAAFFQSAEKLLQPTELALLTALHQLEETHHQSKPLESQLKILNVGHLSAFQVEQNWTITELEKLILDPKTLPEVKARAQAVVNTIQKQLADGKSSYYSVLDQTMESAVLLSNRLRPNDEFLVWSRYAYLTASLYGPKQSRISEMAFFPSSLDVTSRDINQYRLFGLHILGRIGHAKQPYVDGTLFTTPEQFTVHDADHAKMSPTLKARFEKGAKTEMEIKKSQNLWNYEQSTFRERLRMIDTYINMQNYAQKLKQHDRDLLENTWFYLTHEGAFVANHVPSLLNRIKNERAQNPNFIAEITSTFKNSLYLGTQFSNPENVTAQQVEETVEVIRQLADLTPYRIGL